jgi:hypothetical protein
LAHYLTEHYLTSTPRRQWERIAGIVEDALPATAPVARRPSPADVAARRSITPLLVPAN